MTSLVLQQLVYRKGRVPVLFACIRTEESLSHEKNSAYFAEQLLAWFRERQQWLVRCVGKETVAKEMGAAANGLDEVENELCHKIAQIDEEIAIYNRMQQKAMQEIGLAGLFCIGNRFWLFSRGNVGVYLLNRRFERTNCMCLSRECLQGEGMQGKVELLSGLMEADIGLLLATGDFIANMTRQELQECLAVKELKIQEQANRRLQELGRAAERRGGHHMGAILLVTS